MFKFMGSVVQKIKDFIVKNPKLSILIILAIIAAWTFVSIESLHLTSEPGFCQNCHPNKKPGPYGEVYTWKQNIHARAEVKCLDCHGMPGFVGYMKAKIGGIRDLTNFVIKSREHMTEILTKAATDPQYAVRLVPNDICLFCHTDSYNQKTRSEKLMSIGVKFRKIDGVKNPEFRQSYGLPDILTEKLRSDIDPNHKKHLDKGVNCVDCHLGVAHGGEFKNKVDLKRCSECHDKRKSEISMSDIKIGSGDTAVNFSHNNHTAMFKCDECHTKVFPMKKGTTKISFEDHGKDKLCYTCHNGKKASSDCTTCHAKAAAPKLPIIYKSGGMPPVNFSHEFHTAVFKCDECHTKIWPMKRGAKKMKMDDLYQGKFCGACHNDKIAFASTSCDKCHKQK